MLKKYAQFFKSLFVLSDLLILSLAWVLSYALRFWTDLVRVPTLDIPPFSTYLELLLPLWVIWGLVSYKMNLYRPRRIEHMNREFWDMTKCFFLSFLILVMVIYLLKRFGFSRLGFFYFWVIGLFGLNLARLITRRMLKRVRRRGYNQRFALIAGTGELGQKVLEKIELHPDLGIQVIGFLSREAEQVGKEMKNVPILGTYEDLERVFKEERVDIFFVALPINEYDRLSSLLQTLQAYPSDVRVIPGAYEFIGLRGGVDELDDLPMVNLQSSPLYGWNGVLKRAFDITFGMLILIAASPAMLIVSLLIKLTSKGPVLYRQERVGMDGRPFQMLKFRTMRTDAEEQTGPVWATENDQRRIPVGILLRKTSLDELPQLINVIRGEMSLVGPRPERPFFVEKFRFIIPSYLLRHKIKAGMTGWAQINGFRGNSSVEKRTEHDLFYIENWSIVFDFRILVMTLWKGFLSKSAY